MEGKKSPYFTQANLRFAGGNIVAEILPGLYQRYQVLRDASDNPRGVKPVGDTFFSSGLKNGDMVSTIAYRNAREKKRIEAKKKKVAVLQVLVPA